MMKRKKDENRNTPHEIWELCDADGRPAGVLYDRSSGKEIPHGYHFLVSEVFVKAGELLLLTQRHPSKWAGLKWEASGGGVLRGESVSERAVRELLEETGIRASEGELIYLGRDYTGAAIVESYLLRLSEIPSLKLQPSEVVDYKYINESEIGGMIGEFTPGTRVRLDKYHTIIWGRE